MSVDPSRRVADAPGTVLVYVDRFLPASQAFVMEQALAHDRHAIEFLAGRRIATPLAGADLLPVCVLKDSPGARLGELLMKAPRVPVPSLFPVLRRAGLVHAHFGKNGYVIGPVAARAGVPLVTTWHGFDATYAGDPRAPGGVNQVRFFRRGRRQMAGWSGGNIAVSKYIREKLLALGFPEARVFQHYVGVDVAALRSDGVERRADRVVSIARFVEVKGHRLMIDALARVAAAGREFEFVMVGQGPLRAEIEAYARKRLPRFTIIDALGRAEIRELLASARLYLHGSVSLESGQAEALGIAVLEAQAAGTPVVAFDSGGVGEALKPEATGYLVPERNVRAMADKIGLLLTSQDLWMGLSETAPSWVAENFDIRSQTGKLADYYDEIIRRFAAGYRES